MPESKPDRGWRSWTLLEWLLFASVWVVVGAHMFSVGVAGSLLYSRARARVAGGGEPGPPGPESPEHRS